MFDSLDQSHIIVEIDREIISMVILLLLIQDMCSAVVRLTDIILNHKQNATGIIPESTF